MAAIVYKSLYQKIDVNGEHKHCYLFLLTSNLTSPPPTISSSSSSSSIRAISQNVDKILKVMYWDNKWDKK